MYDLFSSLGYLSVFLIVGLESIGFPVPGETALVAAAIYAGTTYKLNIFLIILAAVLGAIFGDNIGYWIGRKGGLSLLSKYGKIIHIDEGKLELGKYIFNKYGGRVVFFGRFFSLFRIFAALLAGINKMGWGRFIFFNIAGAICWATIVGLTSFIIGKDVYIFDLPLKLLTFGLGLSVFIGGFVFTKYIEKHLRTDALKEKNCEIEENKSSS